MSELGMAAAPSAPTEVDSKARKALWGAAIGYAMDGFDLLILGFMLRAISADLQLSQAQAASLVTATLVGAVLGGIGFGMLSDRLGRVRGLRAARLRQQLLDTVIGGGVKCRELRCSLCNRLHLVLVEIPLKLSGQRR